MRTYLCCDHCRVRSHQPFRLTPGRSQPYRDDHPHACAKCPANGRGQQETDDVRLPWFGRAA